MQNNISKFTTNRNYSTRHLYFFSLATVSFIFFFLFLSAIIPTDGLKNIYNKQVGNDYIAYYSASVVSRQSRPEKAYQLETLQQVQEEKAGLEKENLPWRYPPIYFLYVSAFSELDYLPSFYLYTLILLIALLLLAYKMQLQWFFLVLIPTAFPVAYNMIAGQNGSLSALFIGSGILLLRTHKIISGIFFGLMAYKPHLAIIIPFCLLAGQHYKTFFSMSATVVALLLISTIVYGIESWQAFFDYLLTQSSDYLGSQQLIWNKIHTIFILVYQLSDSSVLAGVMQVFSAVLAILVNIWIWKKTPDSFPRSLSLVVAIPMITPYVFSYDMALLIIPVLFLLQKNPEQWTKQTYLNLSLIWFSIPTFELLSDKTGFQLGPVFWIILLAYALQLTNQYSHSTVLKN